MARVRKKHVCSCGEEFPHGIGLRKHQRETGHKGSSVVGDDGSGGAPDAPPAPDVAVAAPVAAPQQAPPPVEKVSQRSQAPPAQDDFEDPGDQTVAVTGSRMAPSNQQAWPPEIPEGPSRYQHNRQKLSLVGRGLRVLVSYRARSAGHQLKQSAQSGADIFSEALKIALSLLFIIAIPVGIFFWWRSQRSPAPVAPDVPASFSLEQGAVSARNATLQYLDALEKGRWEDAYARLSSGWRAEMSQGALQDSCSGIDQIRWAVDDQRMLPTGGAEVAMVLAFVENGKAKKFRGRFRLIQEGQAWKVDRLELSSAASP